MVTLLVDLQRKWIGRTDELLALGLPDWRGTALTAKIADVVARTAGCSRRSGNARRASSPTCRDGSRTSPRAAFPTPWSTATSTPATSAATTLDLTILDWGDSGVGHPLLDQPAFLERMPAPLVPRVEAHWIAEWQRAVPGSDPARASALLAPIAAARQAVIYRMFLDNIEPQRARLSRDRPASLARREPRNLSREG